MQEVWFTSDTHFFHKRIVELANRPFANMEEMNEVMIQKWNERVRKGDLTYFLGSDTSNVIDRLNGQIHVIRGNHDDGLERFKTRFVTFQSYKEIKIGTQNIVLFHYPIAIWHGANKGYWNLHGHSHGNFSDPVLPRYDVGVDPNNFAPVSFDEVSEIMKGRSYTALDHHSNPVASYDSSSAD
jgi:calcineurin-like phosphoesterase family protein